LAKLSDAYVYLIILFLILRISHQFKLLFHKDKLEERTVLIKYFILDIYIMMVSDVHNVCKKGFYVCILSTYVETNNPQKELDPAFEIIG